MTSSKVLGDTVLQSSVLESLSSAVNYRRWFASLALPHLGDEPVELGSGHGDYATEWLGAGVPRIALSDLDPDRRAELHQRFASDSRVSVMHLDAYSPTKAAYSSLVAYNVFEHVPDHVRALRAAHTLLNPGGKVIVVVPAFELAMSRFDREIGHVRRYTVRSLSAAFTEAGLEPVEVRYVNMPGLPAWMLMMKLLRQRPKEGMLLSMWDRRVVPVARRWESKHKVPFGQSVFGVARVPD